MTVFFIDINSGMLSRGLNVLIDYCKKYKLKYFILKENVFNVHPSWLKLKAFDYVDDDFILCWDTDLLPHKTTENVYPLLDTNKLNLVEDSSIYLKTINDKRVESYFKYNCGFIGIPNKYKNLLNEVFNESTSSDLPSYEQYHINKKIKENNINVHVLPKEWNTLFHLPSVENSFIQKSKLIHYTNSQINAEHRNNLIEKHYQKYFNLTGSIL